MAEECCHAETDEYVTVDDVFERRIVEICRNCGDDLFTTVYFKTPDSPEFCKLVRHLAELDQEYAECLGLPLGGSGLPNNRNRLIDRFSAEWAPFVHDGEDSLEVAAYDISHLRDETIAFLVLRLKQDEVDAPSGEPLFVTDRDLGDEHVDECSSVRNWCKGAEEDIRNHRRTLFNARVKPVEQLGEEQGCL